MDGLIFLVCFITHDCFPVSPSCLTQVNGKRESLPSKLTNNLSVQLTGNTVVIDITPAVRVTYSDSQEVTVIVDGTLTDKLCGACGNSNDDPKDDMQTANGKVTNNVAEIVASWSAGDFSRWWVMEPQCKIKSSILVPWSHQFPLKTALPGVCFNPPLLQMR